MKQHEQSLKQQEQLLKQTQNKLGLILKRGSIGVNTFAIDETPDNMKLRYTYPRGYGRETSFRRLCVGHFSRFSNAMFKDLTEEIASLTQDDDLHDYNTAFDALLNKVTLSET